MGFKNHSNPAKQDVKSRRFIWLFYVYLCYNDMSLDSVKAIQVLNAPH
jgi:hypothetical protein